MIALLAHDTGASGLLWWNRDELAAGRVDGLVLDPFHSPGATRNAHPRTGNELMSGVRDQHPHARLCRRHVKTDCETAGAGLERP